MTEHTIVTIFGGTGDLTYRKLLPALYNLFAAKELSLFDIVIIGRRPYDHATYCEIANGWVKQFARLPYHEDTFAQFASAIRYYQMDFTNEAAYEDLRYFYEQLPHGQHIFYLAVAPRFFADIAQGLTHVPVARKQGRIVIEKPFGEDLESAYQLNQQLEEVFSKQNIYHIDHYLGKEMVRNIHTLRFANPIFSALWNHEAIEHVQISAMEEVGVETRGGYYDHSGALKDMVQNHLFQILSILAMEPLDTFTKDDLQQKQLAVLRQLREVEALDMKDTMILGQYEGYRKEANVQADSNTETYAALRLFIDNDRWQGTPFYIRTGKKLNRREMEVIITFRRPSLEIEPDVLVIKIQPTEGVYVRFNIKQPGNSNAIIPASMDFCQSCFDIHRINTPEAYERLIMAVVQEDSSWFSGWDQIALSWSYIEALKQQFSQQKQPVYTYAPGSEGPQETNQLLAGLHHEWMRLV